MVLQAKEQEFRSLFSEMVKGFLRTDEGEIRLRFYDEGRMQGRKNFEALKGGQGDITDGVLRGLLPTKYSPLQPNGNGLQSVYLTETPSHLPKSSSG
jgi:hypothetical protein